MALYSGYQRRTELVRIYDSWQGKHRYRHAAFIIGLCIFVTLFMLGFDRLFVADAHAFTIARLQALAILIPAFLINRSRVTRLLGPKVDQYASSMFLLLGPTLLHLQYYFFVFILNHEKIPVYFTGLLLVVFYGSFILHKFVLEQYFFNLFGLVATLPFAFAIPAQADLAYIIVVCHLISAFIFVYFRRDFTDNLFSIYGLLRIMVPSRVAEVLAISFEESDAALHFRPKEHFTVCLCADWRNFQHLAASKTSDEVSEMLETYYDLVLDKLEQLFPNNNYYFNWTADELFVVFFSEDLEPEPMMRDALSFAQILQTEVFSKFTRAVGEEVRYDIGLSAGPGFLGLQGPKHMKKTTITGEVAGRAKRLESEARRIRGEAKTDLPPILVIDYAMFDFVKSHNVEGADRILEIKARSKDIIGSRCFCWMPASEDQKLVTVKSA